MPLHTKQPHQQIKNIVDRSKKERKIIKCNKGGGGIEEVKKREKIKYSVIYASTQSHKKL